MIEARSVPPRTTTPARARALGGVAVEDETSCGAFAWDALAQPRDARMLANAARNDKIGHGQRHPFPSRYAGGLPSQINETAMNHLFSRGFKIDGPVHLFMSNRPFGNFDRFITFAPPVVL